MLQRCEGHWPVGPAVAVGVAQLVERQTVDLDVAGSNPVTHPMILKDVREVDFSLLVSRLRGGLQEGRGFSAAGTQNPVEGAFRP